MGKTKSTKTNDWRKHQAVMRKHNALLWDIPNLTYHLCKMTTAASESDMNKPTLIHIMLFAWICLFLQMQHRFPLRATLRLRISQRSMLYCFSVYCHHIRRDDFNGIDKQTQMTVNILMPTFPWWVHRFYYSRNSSFGRTFFTFYWSIPQINNEWIAFLFLIRCCKNVLKMFKSF